MKTFTRWAIDHAPAWLAGPVGALYVQALGVWHDMHVETAWQARKASMLRSDTFHVSALKHLGAERLMPRYPSETDAGYKLRLRGAWTAWPKAGNHQALIEQLAAYGVTAEVWCQGQPGPAPAISGTIWDWDDDLANWPRFWVVITAHPWSAKPTLGSGGTVGAGGTVGTTASRDAVAGVRNLIRHWKAAHSIFQHTIVVVSGSWSSPVTTGDRFDVYANRSAHARYWDGYGKRAD